MRDKKFGAEYHRLRFHEIRARYIKLLGGKCNQCGSQESLRIHSRDPSRHIPPYGRIWTIEELDLCELLCLPHSNARIQSQRGYKVAKGTHGTDSSYRYCKCPKCRKAHARAHGRWREKRKAAAQAEPT